MEEEKESVMGMGEAGLQECVSDCRTMCPAESLTVFN